jgi:hypothetical protein
MGKNYNPKTWLVKSAVCIEGGQLTFVMQK